MLVLAVVAYYGATGIGTSFMSDPVGPAALPKALAVALGVFSLLLILQSLATLRKRRAEAPSKVSEKPWRRHLPALGMLAIGIGYVVIAESVGYMVGIALLLLAVILYQGASWTWRPPAIALAGAVFFWLLFVRLLGIGQPEGIWRRLLASLGV